MVFPEEIREYALSGPREFAFSTRSDGRKNNRTHSQYLVNCSVALRICGLFDTVGGQIAVLATRDEMNHHPIFGAGPLGKGLAFALALQLAGGIARGQTLPT